VSGGTVLPKLKQFIKERQYVNNVSLATILWYEQSLCWLNTESPTTEDIRTLVMTLRERGLEPVSVRSRLQAVKAYCRWAGLTVVIPKMKIEQRVLPIFDAAHINRLMQWRPRTTPQHRLQALIATLCDSGARIDECLSLCWADCDFDNLLLTLHGKGRKDRKTPMSLELRKKLFLWQQKSETKAGLVFGTRGGTKQGRRNVLRDVKALCRQLGFEPPARTIHAFRHSFATNAIRMGMNPLILQRILGHSTITMTMRYVHLQTDDLKAGHEGCSLLGGVSLLGNARHAGVGVARA
jgi:integrase/recombinase XerD